LPSDAEWEYAAAGGSEQRLYPWGSTEPGTANQYAIYDCNYPSGSSQCTTNAAHVAPVGKAALGAGLWGQLDLAGNEWELTLDSYMDYVIDPCADCAILFGVPGRVTRGGFFANGLSVLQLPQDRAPGGGRSDVQGFRCGRTP
jgi:formylglycine-generating enzyme required for sulfatase activity